jgi:hypothetical protein
MNDVDEWEAVRHWADIEPIEELMSHVGGFEIVQAAAGAVRLKCDFYVYQTSTGGLYAQAHYEKKQFKSSILFAVAHWLHDNVVDVTYIDGGNVERLYF